MKSPDFPDNVVVWEYLGTGIEAFLPYNAKVSKALEHAIHTNRSYLYLDIADFGMPSTIVLFSTMMQIDRFSEIPVRRCYYPGHWIPAKGQCLGFYNKNVDIIEWLPFEVQQRAKIASKAGVASVRLGPYKIQFNQNVVIIGKKKPETHYVYSANQCAYPKKGPEPVPFRHNSLIAQTIYPTLGGAGSWIPVSDGRCRVYGTFNRTLHAKISEQPVKDKHDCLETKQQPAEVQQEMQMKQLHIARSATAGSWMEQPQQEKQLYHEQQYQQQQQTQDEASGGSCVRSVFSQRFSSLITLAEVSTLEKAENTDQAKQTWLKLNRDVSRDVVDVIATTEEGKKIVKYVQFANEALAMMSWCAMCLEEMLPDENKPSVLLTRCYHLMHLECLNTLLNNLWLLSQHKNMYIQCPTCNSIYGKKLGNQPPGVMRWKIIERSLHGYLEYDTIEITFYFNSGTQTTQDPRPGQLFFAVGFPLECFLPASEDGYLVLDGMREAFRRHLLFRIGRSLTTGIKDVVECSIKLKTQVSMFPDEHYVEHCLNQLSDLGVLEID